MRFLVKDKELLGVKEITWTSAATALPSQEFPELGTLTLLASRYQGVLGAPEPLYIQLGAHPQETLTKLEGSSGSLPLLPFVFEELVRLSGVLWWQGGCSWAYVPTMGWDAAGLGREWSLGVLRSNLQHDTALR